MGGVIVVDFIDMESRRDQFQLLEHFTSAKNDSARPQIAQLTELGLVELTRNKVKIYMNYLAKMFFMQWYRTCRQ